MNGKHSGNGVVKSSNRTAKYARYKAEDRRRRNSERKAKARIARFQKKD